MKVMLLVRDLAVGGSQRQLAVLAAGLARRGHIVVVCVLYAGGALEAMLDNSGVRLMAIGKSSRWNVVQPLAQLRSMIRIEDPDLLYAFLPTQTTIAALLLPFRSRTRLVFGVRASGVELDRYDALSALTYRTEAWLARRADLVIANAAAVRSDAIRRGMPADRIAVVRNGIDTERASPDRDAGRAWRRCWGIADDAFVVGCVARLDPMKDHGNLLVAAARFAREHPDARFVCVGDGAAGYRNTLRQQAAALGLGDRVIWTGETNDVRAAYNGFDLATLASAFGEGFPNVVGEAMACGVPVVATDVGDVRTIVGTVGEVVPARDPDALCAGWSRLRQRLGSEPDLRAAARSAIIAGYSLTTMVERTEAALSRLHSGHPVVEIARELV